MKNNLPYLNQERLQIIFSLLCDTRSADEAVQDLYGFSDKKLIMVLKQSLYGDKKQH